MPSLQVRDHATQPTEFSKSACIVGMRIIHQTLPAIPEKLGIDKTFKLDERPLYASTGRRPSSGEPTQKRRRKVTELRRY